MDNIDMEMCDADGVTALMRCAGHGPAQDVRLLLTAGANPNARAADGMTALMEAAHRDTAECVTALLDAGADVTARDDEGFTATIFAALNQSYECLRVLLDAELATDETKIAEIAKAPTKRLTSRQYAARIQWMTPEDREAHQAFIELLDNELA